MKISLFIAVCLFNSYLSVCQGGQPWNNPLSIAWSADGIFFDPPTIFQDSSGVPSVIRWKGDTLIAVFQWFRQPNPSPTWDRVATKFSYNKGLDWTEPVPITIAGLPNDFMRPFDPTLVVFKKDSIRIFFSSGKHPQMSGLDSTINTYSARSGDGIHFFFEPGPRVDIRDRKIIDPAVVWFNSIWHLTAPKGAPQDGAFHYVSQDGLRFMPVPEIRSDMNHNWTGNFTVDSINELRFYGGGQKIWYNSSKNGGEWNRYVMTNIGGGDPSVLKVTANKYLMIFVGRPHGNRLLNTKNRPVTIKIFPNPANDLININGGRQLIGKKYIIFDNTGRNVLENIIEAETSTVDISHLVKGLYLIHIVSEKSSPFRIIKN